MKNRRKIGEEIITKNQKKTRQNNQDNPTTNSENRIKENYGEKKNGEALWPAGPGPFRREKKRWDARCYYAAQGR